MEPFDSAKEAGERTAGPDTRAGAELKSPRNNEGGKERARIYTRTQNKGEINEKESVSVKHSRTEQRHKLQNKAGNVCKSVTKVPIWSVVLVDETKGDFFLYPPVGIEFKGQVMKIWAMPV